MEIDPLDRLLEKITTGGMSAYSKEQLICISQFVYYSGIGKSEIIDLLVGDVLEKNGNVVTTINKNGSTILLPEESRRALQDYLKTPKTRNLQLRKRKNPLFPGFRNAKKLERAWKAVDTSYISILDFGIKRYHRACLLRGMRSGAAVAETANHFRRTGRSISAHVENRPIRAGAKFYLADKLIMLQEQAEMLRRGDSDSTERAEAIYQKLTKIEAKVQSPDRRKTFEELRPRILETLSPFLGRMEANSHSVIPPVNNPNSDCLSGDVSEPES